MSRTSKVSKRVKRARREKLKPKKAPPPPAGIKEPSGGWTNGEAVIVRGEDRAMLRVGAHLVQAAARNAERLNNGLDIAIGAASQRAVEAEALVALLKESMGNGASATVPPHLLRCAEIGVSLEWGKVAAVKKKQEELAIEDTDDVDRRLRALNRLASHLGYQGELRVKDEDEEAEGEENEELALGAEAEREES